MKDFAIYCLTLSTTFFAAVWWSSPTPPHRPTPEVWPPAAVQPVQAPAQPQAPPPQPVAAAPQAADLAPLWDALWYVESSHRTNPPDGDGGKAIGPYQIWEVYWQDSGVPGTYVDCRDLGYARRVVLAYWQRYVPEALAAGDYEVLARTHNGGPRGATRPVTLGYWKKVEAYLDAK